MRSAIKCLVAVCAMYSAVPSDAQDWESFGLRNYFLEVKQVYADTLHNDLYVVGSTNWTQDMGISFYRYHDGDWDTIGLFDQNLDNIINWNDTLVVCGPFFSVNGDSLRRIACKVANQWLPFGQVTGSGVSRFKVINGELYALGGGGPGAAIDGQPWSGIAKRVGGHWEPLPLMVGLTDAGIRDITYYQGRLVAVGNIHFEGDPYRDVMILNEDSTWSPIGEQGLYGLAAYGSRCLVYQGDLYVVGGFSRSAGNAGHEIMRWDGNEWHDVGGGLTWTPDNFSMACTGTWMEEHDGLLFVSSGCNYAGNVPAGGIATWDGQRWCGLGDPLPGGCMSFAFLNDTLYANAIQWNTNNYPNDVVRFVGDSWSDTCSVPVGVNDLRMPEARFSAWLSASNELTVTGLDQGSQDLGIVDLAGRSLWRIRVTPSPQGTVTTPWPAEVPSGFYGITLRGRGAVKLFQP